MKQSLLVSLLILSSCGKNVIKTEDTADRTLRYPTLDARSYLSLQQFENCSVADDYIKANLREKLKREFDEQRNSLIRWSNYSRTRDDAIASPEASADKSGSAGDSGAPAEYTKTNTQEAGIDEPDHMKTNGTHIFAISNNRVEIVKSWPANAMAKLATIPVDGEAHSLLLTDDQKLLVMSYPKIDVKELKKEISDKFVDGSEYFDDPYYEYNSYDRNTLRVEIYDVSAPSTPKALKTLHFRGNYLDMRRKGSQVMLVTNLDWQIYPKGIETYIDIWSEDLSLSEFDKKRLIIEAKNEETLTKITFASWMNNIETYSAANWSGVSDDLLNKPTVDCSRIFASKTLGEFGLTTVTNIDLSNNAIDQSAILAPSNSIYVSDSSLYAIYNYRSWWWGPEVDSASKTFIHKFKLTPSTEAKIQYQASGVVDGYINNQFSLDEENDYLRIALTVDFQENKDSESRFSTRNRVQILKAVDQELKVVGQTPDLAEGERIYSARFEGNKGYLVTFRQTDPLYTIDLSNPEAPKVLGELKVNGFSSYIHLMDENHLLTVGQDADPKTGQVTGLKIAIFDVTDPSKPSEKFTHLINNISYSSSEAQYDHHAFNYFASRGLLAIPVGGYKTNPGNVWWASYSSDLRLFKVDLKNGISAKGSVPMNDMYQGERMEFYQWWGYATTRRSVFADDFLYAINEFGIKAVNQDDLKTTLSKVSFR